MCVHHASTIPVPVSERAKQPVPDKLSELIMRCLEKDPRDRPGSAAELGRELDVLSQDHPWTELQARHWWETHPALRAGEPLGPPREVADVAPIRSSISAMGCSYSPVHRGPSIQPA